MLKGVPQVVELIHIIYSVWYFGLITAQHDVTHQLPRAVRVSPMTTNSTNKFCHGVACKAERSV